MVINQNNSYINSFTKGMNSDQAYDQIDGAQYTFAKNLRITKNQLINTTSYNNYSSLHEGIVTPVFAGITATLQYGLKNNFPYTKILAVDTVDRIGTIVARDSDNKISVVKFEIDETRNKVTTFKEIWKSDSAIPTADNLSTILYKELENVIKLYIATGSLPIIILRVDDEGEGILNISRTSQPQYIPTDYVINNRIVPQNRVYIEDIISGHLKTSQVQYTYRYYNKYTNTTQLSPLTNKIQVIDPSRSRENGNAEDTITSVGFTISIKLDNYDKYFQYIQVYRLSYIKPDQDAEVSLIYDGKIKSNGYGKFVLHDVGIEPLQTLTIEEFASLPGLILIPQTIAQNQDYMFCGNVKDDTILRDVEISSIPQKEIITAKVIIADEVDGKIPYVRKHPYYGNSSVSDIVDISFIESSSQMVWYYINQRGVNPSLADASYNNIITSSLLRSLRRGETYRYGVVFYDKYGRRSDVINIGDVVTPTVNQNVPFEVSNNRAIARPIGVKIKVPQPVGSDAKNIVGCQIVRRSSSEVYQKTLLQVALARPLTQGLAETQGNPIPTKYSPYYPSGFLTVNNMRIWPNYYKQFSDTPEAYPKLDATTKYYDPKLPIETNDGVQNYILYQAFSSEIDFRRDDVLSRINVSDTDIEELFYIPAEYRKWSGTGSNTYMRGLNFNENDKTIEINRRALQRLKPGDKQSFYWVFNFYDQPDQPLHSSFSKTSIKNVKDVKMAEWNQGFSNVVKEQDGTQIYDAIKQYKEFTTTIDQFQYNNWCSFCKYDFKPGTLGQPNNNADMGAEVQEFLATVHNFNVWYGSPIYSDRDQIQAYNAGYTETLEDDVPMITDWPKWLRNGYIGPGPSCLLLTTEKDTNTQPFPLQTHQFYTSVCNITHTPKLDGVEADESTRYYGFGNYFEIRKYGDVWQTKNGDDYLTVFDGDIYITPHEFTTMYKCYDFESVDTLQSTQITNFIPLESKVNTCFDYGMNLVNTTSGNLLWEPGSIDGVTSQERPAHQYNMVYSDNDASNDVFTLVSTDKNEINNFKQRTYYSEPKTNGEVIDNFLIFKPAAFIDVDSKYGQITNLFTDKNALLYWQDQAFGKFSVNERSLINDQNGNTIMLGQAGILSRYDYISTKFGMRLNDFCARSTEQGLYWVDINNKAVVAANTNQAINFGEQVNVQNIINDRITGLSIPRVDYDLQNNELLCKCLDKEEQLIFNVKYNFATSVYNRNYSNIAYIKNHIYGLRKDGYNLYFDKYNYINMPTSKYLKPLILEYVVNPSASVTKVFDNQLFVPIKRDKFENASQILNKVKMAFETDIVNKTSSAMHPYNDREGNITYVVPRYNGDEGYGNRIRGKWMKVNITNEDPIEHFTISHIITKFRQSFS